MNRITDKKLSDFLADLAAKTPAPGGGSASALAGAMAAALVAMVAEFTVGKEKYKKGEEDFQRVLKEAKELQKDLTNLIDKDTQAYLEIMESNNSQEAIKKAAEIPLQTAQKSLAVLKLADFVKNHGNQNLYSDSFCAIFLARAAIRGALENVKINIPYLEDKKTIEYFKLKIKKIVSKIS